MELFSCGADRESDAAGVDPENPTNAVAPAQSWPGARPPALKLSGEKEDSEVWVSSPGISKQVHAATVADALKVKKKSGDRSDPRDQKWLENRMEVLSESEFKPKVFFKTVFYEELVPPKCCCCTLSTLTVCGNSLFLDTAVAAHCRP